MRFLVGTRPQALLPRVILMLGLGALLVLFQYEADRLGLEHESLDVGTSWVGGTSGADALTIDAAFAKRSAKAWVEDEGEIVRVLSDDEDGSRHQRWLVETDSGLTLKFAHNIDLAERVPVSRGTTIRFRGLYEYNDEGGVVHWTHRDPEGRFEGGWIERRGHRFE